MTVSRATVPPGQYPPLAEITPTDHEAYIIIAAAVGLSFTLLFIGIRIFVRLIISPGWGFDDHLVGAATLLATVQSVVIFNACGDGLGKSANLISPDKLQSVQQLYYASNLIYILPIVLSRLAVVLFLLRLTPVRQHKLFLKGLLALTVTWGVASLFAIALSCDLSKPPILIGQKCSGYFLRWVVIEAIGCASELALFSMAVWLMWNLQTNRSAKSVVVVSFSSRLLIVVIVGFRLKSFSEGGLMTNPTLLEARFICWTSAEMHYSVLSATIPIIRPLIRSLATHYGGGFGNSGIHTYADGETITEGLSSKGFHMGSVSRTKSMEPVEDLEGMGEDRHNHGTVSDTQAPNEISSPKLETAKIERATSVESDDSQKMIIRKDVTFTICYDNDHRDTGA